MGNTRRILESIDGNLAESMGVRREQDRQPTLGPVPSRRDIGRRPLRQFGKIDINLVIPDPDQPRTQFSDEEIDQLAESIKTNGVLAPIRVRWAGDEVGFYSIVAGERRWRATKRAGIATIDCFFHEGDMSRSDILTEQVLENIHRSQLQPLELARAYSKLLQLNCWSQHQLSDAIHVPASTITRALALLKLPEDIQQKVATGQVSARSGYEISRVKDDYTRRALADKAAAGAITHEDAARAVRQRKGRAKLVARGTKQTFVTEDGWRVVVSSKRKATSYHELEKALVEALDEVRTRIKGYVRLL
jgi:ParB family transcriptional regulator, chromosome partitioning protein